MSLPVATCCSIWMYSVSQYNTAAISEHDGKSCHTRLVLGDIHCQLIGFGAIRGTCVPMLALNNSLDSKVRRATHCQPLYQRDDSDLIVLESPYSEF
jgi:hypothetical protein